MHEVMPVTTCSAPPLGAGTRTGTRQTLLSVPGPARLCFYTDGVTEARVDGRLFGSERLSRTLARLGEDASATKLLDSVAAQSDARPDDMAACLLNVHGGTGAPAILAERLELDRSSASDSRVERFLRDCGLAPADAAATLGSARRELEHSRTVTLELSLADGAPVVSMGADSAIRVPKLTAVGA
jgi:hypothetical protein